MSSYYISATDNGSGVFSFLLQRGGTAPSGGTNINSTVGGSMDLTRTFAQLGIGLEMAKTLAIDDRAAGN